MKFVSLIIIAAIGYALYAYFTYSPFTGQWKSSWELTEKQNPHWNQQQRFKFKKVFGRMTVKISDEQWVSTLDGEVYTDTYQIIQSDGDCYQVEFSESVNEKSVQKLCLVDGNIHYHVPDYNMIEVFTPY